MDLNNYFLRDKDNGTKRIVDIFNKIDKETRKYISDTERPLVTGKIDNYSKFMKDKHLPINPRNEEDIINEFSSMFQRAVLWENPGAMINITPPANVMSIASSFYTSIYNPNFAQDESCGYLMTTELLTSKYLAELVGWDSNKSRGIFTFGGKGTNLYAVKIGIQKAIPDSIENGITNKNIVVISNEKSHPCHREVCDWLGLGKNACLRLPVTENGQVDMIELEKSLRSSLEDGKVIGAIIINGGTTNEIIIDPIKEVVDLRDKLVKEYNLNYIPHIHVDAVIGWAWLFFKDYDFDKNPLGMNAEEIKKIKSMRDKITQIKYADSFGADFHKTGFCPYISSIFMAKDFDDVMNLGHRSNKDIDDLKFGEYSPFEYTLELTRSSIGPVSAYIALETFGVTGFQELIYKLFSNTEYIRNYLDEKDNFEVINMDTEGIATLFIITKPNDGRSYNDFVNSDQQTKKDFLDYNHKFYLYTLKMLEENKINFKITFSKSYKPFGSETATGALKIYPTSPLVNKEELKECLDSMIALKNEYDNSTIELKEERDVPIDFVYRK